MRIKVFEWTMVLASLWLVVKVLVNEEGTFREKLAYILRAIVGDSATLFAREPRHSVAYLASLTPRQRLSIAAF